MLRISQGAVTSESARVCLEGRIAGPWVGELRRYCERFLGNGRRLVLDLAEVSFADREGVAVLRDLAGREALLVNCPLFLLEQLKPPAS